MIMTIIFAIILFLVAITFPSKCEEQEMSATEVKCHPALENNPHNLTFTWKSNKTSVTVNVESHDSVIGFCEMSTVTCTSILPGLVTLHLTHSDIYLLTVIIKNISRDPEFTSEGYWTLKYHSSEKEFLYCTLKVFYKANNVTCTRYSENGALQLLCSTQMIYPEGICRFSSNNIEMNKEISELPVNYTHRNVNGNVIYYRSSCAIVLSLRNIRDGTYNISVTMYPNVTGTDTDHLFGTTSTYQIDFGHPSVILRDCPPIIEVGTRVTCTCERSNLNIRNATIYWLDENEQQINTSNVLHFNVSQDPINYNCVGKTASEGIIDNVPYRPKIIIRPYNLTCQKGQIQDDKVEISCSALGVYPELKCKFIAYDNTGDVKLQSETLANHEKYIIGHITKYMCVLNISKSLIQQELRVFMTMYPHITGMETEVLIFGANVTVLQDIRKPEVPLKSICHDAWYIVITLSIILGFLFVAFGCYCFNKGFKNKVKHFIACLRNCKPEQTTSSNHGDYELANSDDKNTEN